MVCLGQISPFHLRVLQRAGPIGVYLHQTMHHLVADSDWSDEG